MGEQKTHTVNTSYQVLQLVLADAHTQVVATACSGVHLHNAFSYGEAIPNRQALNLEAMLSCVHTMNADRLHKREKRPIWRPNPCLYIEYIQKGYAKDSRYTETLKQ